MSVEEVTSRVRSLTVRSFDVACAYANGGDVGRLAPEAAALDAELSTLLTRCPPHVAARCRVARYVLSHLLTVPEGTGDRRRTR